MRPTVDHQKSDDDSGRIIYLGDVRRKRTGRTRAPDAEYIVAFALIAATAFGMWFVVLFKVAPERLLTYALFFIPLWVALTSTACLIAYWLEWRHGGVPALRSCLRRGVLAASVPVFNLAAAAAHFWSLPLAAVSLLLATVVEVALSRRSFVD